MLIMEDQKRKIVKNKKKHMIAESLIIFFIMTAIIMILFLQKKTPIAPKISTFFNEKKKVVMQTEKKTILIQLKQQENNIINIILIIGNQPVSSVKLQIAYDPQVLTNVSIQKGAFLNNSNELFKSIDQKKGMIQYTVAIPSPNMSLTRENIIGTIHYTPTIGITTKTKINILPKTKITISGIEQSIIQQSQSSDINIGM